MNTALRQKLFMPSIALLVLVFGGTFGYYLLTNGQNTLFDCFYMVMVTLSTVGYGEVINIEGNLGARALSMFLMLGGMGILLYVVTQLTAFFVEGDLTQALRRHKMHKQISNISDHIVVCGASTAALHIVEELLHTKWDIVIVDADEQRIKRLEKETEEIRSDGSLLPHIVGDPTDDRVLLAARVDHAHGVVAALEDDKENLFIIVTTRQIAKSKPLRIIAKAQDKRSIPKLKAAGADSVVSPSLIGGMRLASEMVRPSVVTFLDIMLRDKDENLRVEEISIQHCKEYVGKSLGETDIRDRFDLLVLAVQEANDGKYIYKPKQDFILEDDMTLVVLGSVREVKNLRTLICNAPKQAEHHHEKPKQTNI